jgi:hypothetical protein
MTSQYLVPCRQPDQTLLSVNMPSLEDLHTAAKGLAEHPQDHGWRTIYRLFDHALRHSAPQLEQLLSDCYTSRPSSPTHLLTLLGIALKLEFPADFALLIEDRSYDYRATQLEIVLGQNLDTFRKILLNRQNSFTCARRFLVTQVLLTSYFRRSQGVTLNFADLGTGLGILPRQLNSRRLYERFGPDLAWPGGIADFVHIPLASVFALDKGPFPDLDWVHACYGNSGYYAELYEELLSTIADPDVMNAQVTFADVNLLDTEAVARFIAINKINVASMTYVLYELPVEQRRLVLEAVISQLRPPGLLIVTEPCEELRRQGCVVELYRHSSLEPLTLCFISDGHFKGQVIPLDDFERFVSTHPIKYQP